MPTIVSGNIVDPQGNPSANTPVKISVFIENEATQVVNVVSDDAGHFTTEDLSSYGTVVSVLIRMGEGFTSTPLNMYIPAADIGVMPVDFQAWAYFSISGKVTASTGNLEYGVLLFLQGEWSPGHQSKYVGIDSNGEYSFPMVQAGEPYTVSFALPGYEVIAPTEPYTIDNLDKDMQGLDFFVRSVQASQVEEAVHSWVLTIVGGAAATGLAALITALLFCLKKNNQVAPIENEAEAQTALQDTLVRDLGDEIASGLPDAPPPALESLLDDLPVDATLKDLGAEQVGVLLDSAAASNTTSSTVIDTAESVLSQSSVGDALTQIVGLDQSVSNGTMRLLSQDPDMSGDLAEALAENAAQNSIEVVVAPEASVIESAAESSFIDTNVAAALANEGGAAVPTEALGGMVAADDAEVAANIAEAVLDLVVLA